MIHKNRGNRRLVRNQKINKRLRIMKENGYKGGSLYEKHIDKIENNGGGYVSKHGTLLHYSNCSKISNKTRNKNRYGKNESWSKSDRQKIDSMKDKLNNFNKID